MSQLETPVLHHRLNDDARGVIFRAARAYGYGDPASLRPRLPRLEFAEVCHVL